MGQFTGVINKFFISTWLPSTHESYVKCYRSTYTQDLCFLLYVNYTSIKYVIKQKKTKEMIEPNMCVNLHGSLGPGSTSTAPPSGPSVRKPPRSGATAARSQRRPDWLHSYQPSLPFFSRVEGTICGPTSPWKNFSSVRYHTLPSRSPLLSLSPSPQPPPSTRQGL